MTTSGLISIPTLHSQKQIFKGILFPKILNSSFKPGFLNLFLDLWPLFQIPNISHECGNENIPQRNLQTDYQDTILKNNYLNFFLNTILLFYFFLNLFHKYQYINIRHTI